MSFCKNELLTSRWTLSRWILSRGEVFHGGYCPWDIDGGYCPVTLNLIVESIVFSKIISSI